MEEVERCLLTFLFSCTRMVFLGFSYGLGNGWLSFSLYKKGVKEERKSAAMPMGAYLFALAHCLVKDCGLSSLLFSH